MDIGPLGVKHEVLCEAIDCLDRQTLLLWVIRRYIRSPLSTMEHCRFASQTIQTLDILKPIVVI